MTVTRYAAISGFNVSAAAPTVNDDDEAGYTTNELWFDTTGSGLYLSTSVATGAAAWQQVLTATANATAFAAPKVNSTAGDPGVTNDLDEGYSIGSVWVNTGDGGIFICTSAADGAANWEEVTVVP